MAQMLSNLPIGSKVKFGKYSVSGGAALPINWIVVAKNHSSIPAYPTNSVTLMTEKIIDVFAFDVAEPQNSTGTITINGNGDYKYSNIDQWLNKDGTAGNWYAPTHGYDTSPTNENVLGYRGYANRPAFLNAFSSDEKNIILKTTIRYKTSNGTVNDIERSVFLPSAVEIGALSGGENQGSVFEPFRTMSTASMQCGVTAQLYNDPTFSPKPSSITANYAWWTRSSASTSPAYNYFIADSGQAYTDPVVQPHGIRPVLNLPSSAEISETTDVDGSYTFVWNTAPLSPAEIYIPSSIYGGKSNTISWSNAIDIDGDALTYQLECSVNGDEYTKIYEGAAVVYAHLVSYGTTSISYRVRAIDPFGEMSAYTFSDTINVINNNAPVISGADTNLGVRSDDFTGTYTITDANSDTVTVTEAIDGVQIRSLVATLGEEITYGVTETTWLALANGSHTLTISATDGIDTTVRTIVFTKLVDKFSIQNSTPWMSSTMPSRIMVVVTRNMPSTAKIKVEVCNNGYDASPTWEDATDAVVSGLVHVFSNTAKTAAEWGVLVRVSVERNGATGACYVSAIGGNFE